MAFMQLPVRSTAEPTGAPSGAYGGTRQSATELQPKTAPVATAVVHSTRTSNSNLTVMVVRRGATE